MKTIFYDLETTQLEFCGQILNYAFVTVDENWDEVSSLSGKIKISRTQLPQPGAILANRVDVLDHQNDAYGLSEPIAMAKIRTYLESIIEREKDPVKLIGFNSSRFDLHFLRTSMIRNGVSPYFGKNIVYGDLLHVAQKLSIDNTEFRNLIGVGKEDRPRLNLERLCRLHDLLDGVQAHESRADVELTINLALEFYNRYGIDVRTYCPFEPKSGMSVAMKVFPEWEAAYHIDPDSDASPRALMVKLCEEGNYSLWINLVRYERLTANATLDEQKACVSWYNKSGSVFFTEDVGPIDPKIAAKCEEAKKNLSHINLKNFFPARNCDIEAFIYMMSFNENSALYEAIWMNDLTNIKKLKSKYASELYLRCSMAHKPISEKVVDLLHSYGLFRYGGKMKTNRYDVDENKPESFHKSLSSLYTELNELITNSDNEEDVKLLKSLKTFYDNSQISKICGKELL